MAPFAGRRWHLYDVGCRAVIGPIPSRLSACEWDCHRIPVEGQGGLVEGLVERKISTRFSTRLLTQKRNRGTLQPRL